MERERGVCGRAGGRRGERVAGVKVFVGWEVCDTRGREVCDTCTCIHSLMYGCVHYYYIHTCVHACTITVNV